MHQKNKARTTHSDNTSWIQWGVFKLNKEHLRWTFFQRFFFQCIPYCPHKGLVLKSLTAWNNKTAWIQKSFLQRLKLDGEWFYWTFRYVTGQQSLQYLLRDTSIFDIPPWLQIESSSCSCVCFLLFCVNQFPCTPPGPVRTLWFCIPWKRSKTIGISLHYYLCPKCSQLPVLSLSHRQCILTLAQTGFAH